MVCDSVEPEIVTDSLGLALDEPEIDPGHGGLHTWATLCLDCVYVYVEKLPDGTTRTIREWNTPKAVEDMAALAPRAPVTHLHPPVNLTPSNVAKYAVGDMSGEYAVVDGDEELGPDGSKYKRKRALVPMTVRTAAGQQAATTDARFTSPGYKPIRVNEPGVHPLDGPYDRKRIGVEWVNHVALVPNPRGGTECALALDGLDEQEAQAALDAARPMGYAVAGALSACPASIPQSRRAVKRDSAEDSTMTLDEMIALLMQAFATAKDDPTGGLMRSLMDTFVYSEPFRLASAKAAGQTLARALMPVTTPAATDAELPTDPTALRDMLSALIDERVKAAMMVKPEGSEVEISLGDACSTLMKDMAAMKTAVDGMKGKLDGMGDLSNKVAAAATDAKLAKDSATSACQLATAASTAVDSIKASADARDAADAAAATGRKLAEARHLATTFGMAKDAADAAELPALAAHLRKRRVGGVLETDSDDAVVAAARAASQGRPKPILATDSASVPPVVSPVASLG